MAVREINFLSFKGDAKRSTLDQITMPAPMGYITRGNMIPNFGEWLKRAGHSQDASDEQLCRWALDYWNATLEPRDQPRRFDRMPEKSGKPL